MKSLSRTGILAMGLVVGALFMIHCGGNGHTARGHGSICGEDVCYDGTSSGLFAVEIQGALDEIASLLAALEARVASLETTVASLDARATALEDVTQFQTVQTGDINGLAGPHLIIEGANVHVRSGSGATDDGGTLTGLGNLVVGYNEEPTTPPPGYRDGSHGLVVGIEHSYTS